MKYFLTALALAMAPASTLPACAAGFNAEVGACCKTCRKGKACGDSCIARNKTCHKPAGCACNG
ncbi:hypothetical protein [Sphingomicrobium arenosum]|uniref:hypothetical protein n=1 Tax=Sphingomicrobium arenosum TaxID=2233861 RepID=UPI00224104E8|nr:hypothetical protein [Sphingomicrobium arenosum]